MNTDRSVPDRTTDKAPSRAVLTILMVVMMSLVTSTADARPKKLRLRTVAPDGTTFVKILRQLAQDVQKQSNEDLKFTIYPGGMKGAERQMVQQMRIGSLDAALLTASGLAEIDQSVTALQNMPLMFRTLDEVDLVGLDVFEGCPRVVERQRFDVHLQTEEVDQAAGHELIVIDHYQSCTLKIVIAQNKLVVHVAPCI